MKKNIIRFSPLLLLVVLLCACGPNYAGSGNSFVMHATVDKIGTHSLTVRDYTLQSAEGKATHWFDNHGGDDGDGHQIHNNYNTCGWHHRHVIGHLYDAYGNEIELRNLHPGERVTIEGHIRSNAHSCGKYSSFNSRPVFDRITVDKQ